jgi:hypothetical protein
MAKITIKAGPVTMTATLNESQSAKKLLEALPCRAKAQTWGKEVYFPIPMTMEEEDAQAKVPSGGIAYWPPGKCFCIFFGQTPYSPVNLLGKLDGNPQEFAEVKDGEAVALEKHEG